MLTSLDGPARPGLDASPPGRSAGATGPAGGIRPLWRLLVLLSIAGLLVGLAPAAAAAPAIKKPGIASSASATVGDGWVRIDWKAPTTGGPVESYEVSYRHAGQEIRRTLGATADRFEAKGLTNGLVYEFRLSAINAAGRATTTVRAKPRITPPGEFALTSLTKSTGVINVAWSESTSGTYPLGRYTVYLYAGYKDALGAQPVAARTTVVLPSQPLTATFTNLNPKRLTSCGSSPRTTRSPRRTGRWAPSTSESRIG